MQLASPRRKHTYARDPIGESTCYDTCAERWSALHANDNNSAVGDWSVIVRKDAKRQWTYKGKPVYTSAVNERVESHADGAEGLWRELTP